jgi:hypothetical protein
VTRTHRAAQRARRRYSGPTASTASTVSPNDHPTAHAGYGSSVLSLIDPAQFPELVTVIRSGSLDDAEDEDFATNEVRFGPDRILDGLADLVDRRTDSAPPEDIKASIP